jgi:hypothetical protein
VAAGLVQRFPEVVQPLRDGRLCITSVVELARVLTRENLSVTLPRFFHRSRHEARELAVEISPAAVIPRREVTTVVAGAPARRETPPPGAEPEAPPVLLVELESTHPLRAVPPPAPAHDPRRDTAEPLTAELRRLHVTVSRRFLAKLEEARAALSHSHPGAGAEEILEAGLDLLIERQARRRGIVEKPRTAGPSSRPAKGGHVAASVKRAVWARDGGRCQWPVGGGGVCGSTLRVELDHVVPRARGGPSTEGNLRVLCRIHNGLAARQALGDGWMSRFTGT